MSKVGGVATVISSMWLELTFNFIPRRRRVLKLDSGYWSLFFCVIHEPSVPVKTNP